MQAKLEDLRQRFPDHLPASGSAVRELLGAWPDGRVKLWIVMRLLRMRRAHEALFGEGAYLSLDVAGANAMHLCAFARQLGPETLIVVVPRLLSKLDPEPKPPLGDFWGDAAIACPRAHDVESWSDVLSGQTLRTERRAGAEGVVP